LGQAFGGAVNQDVCVNLTGKSGVCEEGFFVNGDLFNKKKEGCLTAKAGRTMCCPFAVGVLPVPLPCSAGAPGPAAPFGTLQFERF